MITTNEIKSVIRVLEEGGDQNHKIAAAIGMTPRECSTLLGTMLRMGILTRTGEMRRHVYSLAESFTSPEQIYLARVRLVRKTLETLDRMILKDIRELLSESDWTTRLFLNEACKNGDLYKQGKHGFFLSFEHYEHYIEVSLAQRKEKRKAASAIYRKAYRLKPKVVKEDVNIVCEECRQNWQGYQVHKIFGSGARA